MSSAQRGCGVTWTFSRADEKKSELTSTSVGNSPKIEHRGWTRWLPESPSNRCLCDPMKIQCRNLIAQDSNSNLGNKHSGEDKAYLSLTHGCTKKKNASHSTQANGHVTISDSKRSVLVSDLPITGF